ncbi:MAG TPA: hypothetical protein DEF12_02765, partial [Rhodobacteraceae bacterium]|nr:hypothetical protein [Paracoccaceae bacterium]
IQWGHSRSLSFWLVAHLEALIECGVRRRPWLYSHEAFGRWSMRAMLTLLVSQIRPMPRFETNIAQMHRDPWGRMVLGRTDLGGLLA